MYGLTSVAVAYGRDYYMKTKRSISAECELEVGYSQVLTLLPGVPTRPPRERAPLQAGNR